ncbi:MAG: hypothetical protein ABEJ56_01850 [Candidatus Nanohaloarchaea archaeon]
MEAVALLDFLDALEIFSGSDEGSEPGFFRRRIVPWFHTPGTSKSYYTDDMDERFGKLDDPWSKFELFHGDWVEIQNRVEWYESPHIPEIYEDQVHIFKKKMKMGRPDERYYEQDIDSNEFASILHRSEGLPSGRGEMRIISEIATKNPPSGENNFGFVEYLVKTELKYDIPSGVERLPRLIANPLNLLFKWAFYLYVAEEMVEYDGEYARERTTEYLQYLRKYHGEEPVQTKTREAAFKPVPEEGVFFQ